MQLPGTLLNQARKITNHKNRLTTPHPKKPPKNKKTKAKRKKIPYVSGNGTF